MGILNIFKSKEIPEQIKLVSENNHTVFLNSEITQEFSKFDSSFQDIDAKLFMILNGEFAKMTLENQDEALNFIKLITALKKDANLSLTLELQRAIDSCASYNNVIISGTHAQTSRADVIVHELGHVLFNVVNQTILPKDALKIIEQARINADNNPKFVEISSKLEKINEELQEKINKETEKYLISKVIWEDILVNKVECITNDLSSSSNFNDIWQKYGSEILEREKNTSLEDVRSIFISKYQAASQETFGIYKLLFKNLSALGLSRDYINSLRKNGVDSSHFSPEQAADIEIAEYYKMKYLEVTNKEYRELLSISDIIDAVYLHGKMYNGPLKVKPLKYHNYTGDDARNLVSSFHEMIANYTQVKVMGNQEDIKGLEELFGTEFITMLEEVYQGFYKYYSINKTSVTKK